MLYIENWPEIWTRESCEHDGCRAERKRHHEDISIDCLATIKLSFVSIHNYERNMGALLHIWDEGTVPIRTYCRVWVTKSRKNHRIFWKRKWCFITSIIVLAEINELFELLPHAIYWFAPTDYLIFPHLRKLLGGQIFAKHAEVESAVDRSSITLALNRIWKLLNISGNSISKCFPKYFMFSLLDWLLLGGP